MPNPVREKTRTLKSIELENITLEVDTSSLPVNDNTLVRVTRRRRDAVTIGEIREVARWLDRI